MTHNKYYDKLLVTRWQVSTRVVNSSTRAMVPAFEKPVFVARIISAAAKVTGFPLCALTIGDRIGVEINRGIVGGPMKIPL